jgi:hypothetical protein
MEKVVHWDVLCQKGGVGDDDALVVTAGHKGVVAGVEQVGLRCSGVVEVEKRISDGCLSDDRLDGGWETTIIMRPTKLS